MTSTVKAYTYPLDNKTVYPPKQQRLCKKIGCGSYGQVFEACNVKNVVKQVDKYDPNDQSMKSFDIYSITEMVVLKKTMFSNIPKVMSVSSTADKLLIEMNNCGRTIYDLSRKLSFEQRCKILPWVAFQLIRTALQLEVNGIIHNDIKSGNVLVNDELVLSLIDFGLCVFESVENNNNAISICESWGTYCICPPEMFLEGRWVPNKLMSWSIGITLCEFLYSTHNFLRDYVFTTTEKTLYTRYTRYDNMLKSLMVTAFSARKDVGMSAVYLDMNVFPHDIIELISKLLTFNPNKRTSLIDALQLPMFHNYYGKQTIDMFTVPDIYYHQVKEPLLHNVNCKKYIEYRQHCIQWMYETLSKCKKMCLFSHAVSVFDRFLSKTYAHQSSFVAVSCAAMYIVQYVKKYNPLRLVTIVDNSRKLSILCKQNPTPYTEVERFIQLMLVVLDYDLYYRSLDTLLASQDVPVEFEKILDVMKNTFPPYNNMVLVKNYRKLVEECV